MLFKLLLNRQKVLHILLLLCLSLDTRYRELKQLLALPKARVSFFGLQREIRHHISMPHLVNRFDGTALRFAVQKCHVILSKATQIWTRLAEQVVGFFVTREASRVDDVGFWICSGDLETVALN